MNFEEKLKKLPAEAVWEEYCGFLDLTLPEYMKIQHRLLSEQISLMAACPLGNRLFSDHVPVDTDDFRSSVPLTTFSDYADVLLTRQESMLPAKPVVWLETTREGGDYPNKCAPYSEAMLDAYRKNILAAMILSTSSGRRQFNVHGNARVLYSLAPLPYATGLFPDLISSEIRLRFMPPVKEAGKMSFGQQTRRGYKMAMQKGMDLFFGMSSVLWGATRSMPVSKLSGAGGLSSVIGMKPKMFFNLLKGCYQSKRDGRELRPSDLFRLDGFVCVGTDTSMYKDELEKAWGKRPLELTGGTEPSCMGTETWSKNGLAFFPDDCFYEFIPEQEMLRSLSDPGYRPCTYLMDELTAGEKYELVITVLHGGAFMRYRVGDVYRCLRLHNPQDGLDFPQFEYIDRIPTVIDIAGFTRITEREITNVIDMSSLPVGNWFAVKEYDREGHSYLHLFAEMKEASKQSPALTREIIAEHLTVYFRYYDGDYRDLKKLLGVDPLKVTMLPAGSIEKWERSTGTKLQRVGAPAASVCDLLKLSGLSLKEGVDV